MRLLLLLLAVPLLAFGSSHALFIPPEGWKQANPKSVTDRTLVAFLHTKKSGFCPSLNLTRENINVPLDKYLSIVQKRSLAKKRSWKHLGQIETIGGTAELIEIEAHTKFGPARLLQAILHKNGVVHILTAGVLKKQFGKYLPEIQASLRSLSLCDDLFSLAPEGKRESLRSAWQKKRGGVDSKEYNELIASCSELGVVWQNLMLKQ